jgi:hypothetical protein
MTLVCAIIPRKVAGHRDIFQKIAILMRKLYLSFYVSAFILLGVLSYLAH